jgi:hypothetical protein
MTFPEPGAARDFYAFIPGTCGLRNKWDAQVFIPHADIDPTTKTNEPRSESIRTAARHILNDSTYRKRARELAREDA